ncbi:hypothetical protein CROQUDRAFT_57168 [Cronartium quercuum f. sp. fusiforme G11]|uniref:N-alpha-acetyltransferase 60 n=1 Tax=Cronartium quercuum f. sp. fusiforme G11 TaxID=708437 RepID=A0A9P6TGN5_9BASI|nr:hypothetical protein CROQUDRAFT_57168 [Cronartium quercuum f. sp. fusiforme G11]
MPGPWLSLLPVTDPPTVSNLTSSSSAPPSPTITSSSTSSSHGFVTSKPLPLPWPKFKSQNSNRPHNHNHHPTPNSILRPLISQTRPKVKKSITTHILSPCSALCLKPLFEQSCHFQKQQRNLLHEAQHRQGFEIRPLQVCDIDKVKELHHATLPVSYPTSFFCNLLMSQPHDLALVATLPSDLPAGYFDLQQPNMPNPSHFHHHPHQHLLHHVTSPLSGRKPLSLDVVGCITASKRINEIRILTLCVDDHYRRHGVAAMLLRELVSILKIKNDGLNNKLRLSLHVQATNKVARWFYRKEGFKFLTFKKDYYLLHQLKPLDPDLKKEPDSASNSNNSDEEEFEKDEADTDAWFLVLDL